MTEELKQAAQAALEALKNVTDYDQINAARRALERALTQRPSAQTERWIVAAVDAAMVEMKNISPPLRRSECERLIRAAAEYMPAPQQATPEPVGEPVAYREKLTGRLCEPEDTHRRKFPMCYEPLFTHPAPGVPEDVADLLCSVADDLNDMPISDEYAAKTAKKAYELLVKHGVINTPSSALVIRKTRRQF